MLVDHIGKVVRFANVRCEERVARKPPRGAEVLASLPTIKGNDLRVRDLAHVLQFGQLALQALPRYHSGRPGALLLDALTIERIEAVAALAEGLAHPAYTSGLERAGAVQAVRATVGHITVDVRDWHGGIHLFGYADATPLVADLAEVLAASLALLVPAVGTGNNKLAALWSELDRGLKEVLRQTEKRKKGKRPTAGTR